MKTVKLLVLASCVLLIALPLGSTLAQDPTPNTYGILTSTPQPDGSIYHIVQPGESLWVISAAYGIPGSEIMVLNGNSAEANEVYINDVLLIRRANTPTPTSNITPTPLPTTPQPTIFVPSRTPIPTKTPLPTATPTQPPSTAQLLFGDSQKVGWTMVAVSGVGLLLVITFGFLKKPR
jgi:LysM repeat protein